MARSIGTATHNMLTNPTDAEDVLAKTPLAFHIRRLRQWYDAGGLTLAQLADLAGVSYWVLQEYESRRSLPRTVEVALCIALALEVPVETLIDPRRIEQMRTAIAERRSGEKPRQPSRRRRVYAT